MVHEYLMLHLRRKVVRDEPVPVQIIGYQPDSI